MNIEIPDGTNTPVINIDGGAGTGKGTVRAIVAQRLGFHELDSGVLYRAVALRSLRNGIKITETKQLEGIASSLDLKMTGEQVIFDGTDETTIIRSDEIGRLASVVAQIPEIRMALRRFQLGMRKLPGLVADGRDQGEIFDNSYRFFLETSPERRAERRVKQFEARQQQKADYDATLAEIVRRDEVDMNRKISPLKPHPLAWRIDTCISAVEVADIICGQYEKRRRN
jgi:cytidylate kinase